jgi:hypothetical protein
MPNRRRNLGGRPPKPPGTKQSEPVVVKLTPGEYRALLAVAKGEPPATLSRRLILAALKRRRRS